MPISLDGTGSITGIVTVSVSDDLAHVGDVNTKITFPANDTISFETSGSEKLRIDSNGRLLVGATSTSAAVRAVFQGYHGGGDDYQARVQFQTNQATNLAVNQHLANLLFTNSSGSVGAEIRAIADGAWGTNDYPGRLEFYTTPDSSNTSTERLRIDSSGNLIIKGSATNDNFRMDLRVNDTQNEFRGSSNSTSHKSFVFYSANTNTSEKLRITSDGDVHINSSALSSPYTSFKRLSVNNNLILNASNSAGGFGGMQHNAYLNSSGNWVRVYNDHATSIGTDNGNFYFRNAGAGTGTISWNQRLNILANGNIGINRSDPDQRLCVNGNAEFNAYDSSSGSGGYYTAKGLIIGNAYDAGKTGLTDDRNAIIWQERGLDLDIATNDTLSMKISYNGIIDSPTQAGFYARMNTNKNDKTGDGTYYTVEWDTDSGSICYDQHNTFSTSTGLYTIPTGGSGVYQFSTAVCLSTDVYGRQGEGWFVIGGLRIFFDRRYFQNTTGTITGFYGSCIAKMTAGQTIGVQVFVNGGSKNVDIFGAGAADHVSWFSGRKIA